MKYEVGTLDPEVAGKLIETVDDGGITLGDGIYAVSESCIIEELDWDEARKFLHDGVVSKNIAELSELHPEFVIANPYETDTYLFLSERPEVADVTIIGRDDFGHGAAAFIDNCPKRVLILGEND